MIREIPLHVNKRRPTHDDRCVTRKAFLYYTEEDFKTKETCGRANIMSRDSQKLNTNEGEETQSQSFYPLSLIAR